MRTIRSLLFAAPVALAVSLGGCATTGTGGTISTTDVQNAAVAACGFLPTAATVASIVSAATGGIGGGILETATSVASAICAAVVPVKQASKRGAVIPTVNGVAIHGRWVR